MVRPVPKMPALVVSAIRNLRDAHGSTSKEILNYLASEYDASEPTVQRQMYTALRRGLACGILKRVHGHYSLNSEPNQPVYPHEAVPMEKSGRRRRRGRRRGRRRRKSRRVRRRRAGRRGGRRRTRGVARKRTRGGRGRFEDDVLSRDPLGDRRADHAEDSQRSHDAQRSHRARRPSGYEQRERVARSRSRSRSRSRPRTHSRSSESSERDGSIERPDGAKIE